MAATAEMTLAADNQRTGLARIAEACEYLAVSRASLYTLMDRGALKYIKLGKSRRIPWTALVDLAKTGAA